MKNKVIIGVITVLILSSASYFFMLTKNKKEITHLINDRIAIISEKESSINEEIVLRTLIAESPEALQAAQDENEAVTKVESVELTESQVIINGEFAKNATSSAIIEKDSDEFRKYEKEAKVKYNALTDELKEKQKELRLESDKVNKSFDLSYILKTKGDYMNR